MAAGHQPTHEEMDETLNKLVPRHYVQLIAMTGVALITSSDPSDHAADTQAQAIDAWEVMVRTSWQQRNCRCIDIRTGASMTKSTLLETKEKTIINCNYRYVISAFK